MLKRQTAGNPAGRGVARPTDLKPGQVRFQEIAVLDLACLHGFSLADTIQ